MDESLIPPEEMLFDGTTSREGFMRGGPGFLWNSLVARGGLKPEHTVLDMGFGNGKHAIVLTQYLKPPEGRYFGFDIVRESVEWCQAAYRKYPNFQFDFADLRSDWYNPDAPTKAEDFAFPYADSTFDVAFASSLFTHLEPEAARNYLHNVRRVLKPGGRVLLTCFLTNEHNSERRGRVQSMEFTRASPVHHVLDRERPSRGIAYDENAFRKMIQDAGLVACEITFGTWANEIDYLSALQDAIVAIKR